MNLVKSPNPEPTPKSAEQTLCGNILLFHAFDLGQSIDIKQIKDKKLLTASASIAFPHFKNYHLPLFVEVPGESTEVSPKNPDKPGQRIDCLYTRIHNFGALSFCYKIPFVATLDTLKVKVIQTVGDYRKVSKIDAANIFERISLAITQPHFFNLCTEYYAIQVNSLPEKLDAEEFKEKFGSQIASMLRLETETLSEFQEEDILESVTGYYGKDMIIIDTEGAFIFDDEYYETIEFFELANVQKLELQCFDKILDQELNYLHKNEKYKLSWMSYVPVIGTSLDNLLARLVHLRLDVSVVSERLSNSVKMVGDAYCAKLYSMLVGKLGLGEWKASINEKMDIVNELYMVRKNILDTARAEILEIVIIFLIAMDLVVAFLKH
jgi:hypothetical protein